MKVYEVPMWLIKYYYLYKLTLYLRYDTIWVLTRETSDSIEYHLGPIVPRVLLNHQFSESFLNALSFSRHD